MDRKRRSKIAGNFPLSEAYDARVLRPGSGRFCIHSLQGAGGTSRERDARDIEEDSFQKGTRVVTTSFLIRDGVRRFPFAASQVAHGKKDTLF